MTTYRGADAKVVKGTYDVAEMVSWELDIPHEENDTSAFGSAWGKSDVGQATWSMTLSGWFDATDTDGQKAIESAKFGRTFINDIKLFVNDTSFWTPDLTLDSSAGCRVTDYKIGQEKKGVCKIDFKLSGSGPVTFQ